MQNDSTDHSADRCAYCGGFADGVTWNAHLERLPLCESCAEVSGCELRIAS